jgi:cell division protein FtsQ
MEDFRYNQPDTRARIAARRKRTRVPQGESGVLPGPRRVVTSWLACGKIASLALFVAAVYGLWHVSTSPNFTVRDVQVIGAQALKAREVVQLAGANGESIWLVDTNQIAARLAESAYVERAEARVAWPDQLLISVTERRPEVRWRSNGVSYLVTADGRVLGQDTTAAVTNTLVIEDRSARALQPNDRVNADALQLSQLIAVRLPVEAGMTPAEIGWDERMGVFITTGDKRTIVFGDTEHLDQKIVILETLLVEGVVFTYLDLRPTTPFYRNDGTEPAAPAP